MTAELRAQLSAALLLLGMPLAMAGGVLWATRSTPRPPIPPVVAQVEAADKRVTHHVYMLHGLTADGVSGPWICYEANVGDGKGH